MKMPVGTKKTPRKPTREYHVATEKHKQVCWMDEP